MFSKNACGTTVENHWSSQNIELPGGEKKSFYPGSWFLALPNLSISPPGSTCPLMFSCFLWTGSLLCVFGGSVCCPGRQNAQGHCTTVSLYQVALAATFTWLPESLHLQSYYPLPQWWLKTRLTNPTRNIPGSGFLSLSLLSSLSWGIAKPNACIMLVSQPWSKREFVFRLLCLGQNQRTYWTPPACLFTLPSFSLCSRLTATPVEVGGSLAFTGKHKKQRQVPKCLAWKKALFIPWSQDTLQSFGWDLGSEMPWTLLSGISVQQINQHSLQHSLE